MADDISDLKNQLFSNFGSGGGIFKSGGGSSRRWIKIGLALLALLVVFSMVMIVPAGSRAVVFNNFTGGLSHRGEGTTLLLPFMQSATVYDVKTQTYTMSKTADEGDKRGDDSIRCLTSDGQQVDLDITVRFHPDPARIVDLHRNIGVSYIEKIIRPVSRSVVRAAVSQFSVTDVYGGRRGQLQEVISTNMERSLATSFLLLDEAFIRNVDFSDEYKKAIEQKQIAQQEAERKKYELEKEKVEKERKIIEAEGEAEAIKLRGEALARNPALIQYEYVQKITPGVQTIITDGRSILSLGDLVRQSGGAKK
jgi:regulator of protease activity HflC (stomatin/prohibitin superfamily)